MFLKNDIYTSSGSTKLYHCWTDKVTKFDSSSFYNWEQDNLPVYDLEERTHLLWEQLGFPASSLPGVALVVSADASNNDITCNKNVFRSLSAAIEAIPQTINFPILIEVASFGNIGNIVISNRRFGPSGSLEIINRNFAKQDCTVSNASNSNGTNPPVVGTKSTLATNYFNYLSSVDVNPSYYDVSNVKLFPLTGFLEASCLSISAPVFSSTRDSRLSGAAGVDPNLNAYISVRKFNNNYNRATLVIDDQNDVQPFSIAGSSLSFKAYDLNPVGTDEITTRDASTLNNFTGYNIYVSNNYLGEASEPSAYNGLFYGNKLNSIVINNCDGKIFIRNFFLDGGGSSRTNNINGVEVYNSPNVFLENLVATRFRKTGFNFVNSKVTLLRGCVATRIYDYDSSGTRLTDLYSNRRKFLTFNTSAGIPFDDYGAGILANNSTIVVSSTHTIEEFLYSGVFGTTNRAFIPSYYIFEFTKNANGIVLNNSTLEGGKIQDVTKTNPTRYEIVFDMAHNVGTGLISNNSKVSLDGRVRFIENLFGCQLNNSVFEIDRMSCIANQKQALTSFNSKILYNKTFSKHHNGGTKWESVDSEPISFINNGQHLLMSNSTLTPLLASSMEENYGRLEFTNPIGKLINGGISEAFGILEGVRLQNNSQAILISPKFTRDAVYSIGTGGNPYSGKKGSELLVTDSSKAVLRGTRYFATKSVGPSSYYESVPLASICAENNSMIQINGPTVMAQFGVDLMADNNSKILISAPRQLLDNSLDISSINLANGANHTAVELHSVRSCIVADNNSMVEMKDLGSFITNWLSGTKETSSLQSSGLDYYFTAANLQLYTSAGSMQFYPNPLARPTTNYTGSIVGVDSVGAANLTSEKFTYDAGPGYNYYFKDPTLNGNGLTFSSVTRGGMCVRAVNNSIVNIHNVNFPCGWWNASAPYYDGVESFASSTAPFRTFIWNIADSSQLKASYVSISSTYPRLAGYHGPLGYWPSGSLELNYGVPSSTPDTSALSLLDFYGRNPSSTPYSVSSHRNYGPFRIYFSVDSVANTLTNATGGGWGIIPQLYAQGYQPSSLLACSSTASATYISLLQRNSSGNINPSGYYYSKDIVNNSGFSRALLDESGSEAFANAKHCSVGKSNCAKTVSLYFPYYGDISNVVRFGDSSIYYGLGSVNVFDIERSI